MPSHPELREDVIETTRHLFTTGVMSHSGHGNLSARVDHESFLLTTTGMVRELTVEQLAWVDVAGKTIEGDLASENAEIVAMHAAVYLRRPDVGGVIHTHSPHATAFALANMPLPCRHEPLLRFGQAETVPVVPWGPRGSNVSVRGIEDGLERQPGTNAVLLANHGVLVFGHDPLAAAHLVVAIEEAAEAELSATAIGGAKDFPPEALQMVRDSMEQARRGRPQ